MKKSKIVFTFNAPAVLFFALLSLGALGLAALTGGASNHAVFSVYRSGFLSPMAYVRLLFHPLGHTSFSHYVSNMALLLALGPIVEERYGMMGASGVVYMLIFLASTSGSRSGEIPLTLVAVAALYLTQEILGGLFSMDDISHLSHIVGGVCGAVMGLRK